MQLVLYRIFIVLRVLLQYKPCKKIHDVKFRNTPHLNLKSIVDFWNPRYRNKIIELIEFHNKQWIPEIRSIEIQNQLKSDPKATKILFKIHHHHYLA